RRGTTRASARRPPVRSARDAGPPAAGRPAPPVQGPQPPRRTPRAAPATGPGTRRRSRRRPEDRQVGLLALRAQRLVELRQVAAPDEAPGDAGRRGATLETEQRL